MNNSSFSTVFFPEYQTTPRFDQLHQTIGSPRLVRLAEVFAIDVRSGYSKDFFQLHKFHVRCKFEGG